MWIRGESGNAKVKVTVEDKWAPPLFCWHGVPMKLAGKKSLLLVNDASCTCVLLLGIGRVDLREAIPQAIGECLQAAGISPRVAQVYLKQAGAVQFSHQVRPEIMQEAERFADVAKWQKRWDTTRCNQVDFSLAMGMWFCSQAGHMAHPKDLLLEQMASFAADQPSLQGVPLIEVQAYQFYLSRQEGEWLSWRRFTIPSATTFGKLHNVISDIFSWQAYLPHSFTLKKRGQPTVEVDGTAGKDNGTRLDAYLPAYRRMVYRYGNHMENKYDLKLERVLEGCQENYPVCLAGFEGPVSCSKQEKKEETQEGQQQQGGQNKQDKNTEQGEQPQHPTYDTAFSYGSIQNDGALELINLQLRGAMGRSRG